MALKDKAFMLLLLFADTDVCPRQMAVFDVPYCASVGFVFKPLHMSRCWQKKFSIMSEFI